MLTKMGEIILWFWDVWIKHKTGKKLCLSGEGATPRQKPSLIGQHIIDIEKHLNDQVGAEMVIVGHTHKMGTVGNWYANLILPFSLRQVES